MIYTEGGGGIALWINVDHKNIESAESERGSNIDGRGSFSNATLLVRHHKDAGVLRAWQRRDPGIFVALGAVFIIGHPIVISTVEERAARPCGSLDGRFT